MAAAADNQNPNIMSNNDNAAPDYESQVRFYSDDELLIKERSKRRRKTGDMVGTGLSAAAAMGSPALWAVAGASVKSYLGNSSKHKIIMKEISRRGLTPLKGELSDAVLPIFTSAGSMVVGRAFGGNAGIGMASQAGNMLHNVGNRAFGSNPTKKDDKKDKTSKKSKQSVQPPVRVNTQVAQSMVPYGQPSQQPQALQTPSAYQLPANQAPPQTITYQYVPPSPQYPQGCYAPVLSQQQPSHQMSVQSVPSTPPPAYQTSSQQQPAQQYHQPTPPALMYQNAPSQPQYYQNPPQQPYAQQATPQPGLNRASTIYSNTASYAAPHRAQTVAYM